MRYRGPDLQINGDGKLTPIVAADVSELQAEVLVENNMLGVVTSAGMCVDPPWNTPITIRFNKLPG